ncbi:MAG: acyl-CoA thioesterase [Oligoflexia bacterium]|nr:acyl-CoA thioesterase [Oligoflexia bacterium]
MDYLDAYKLKITNKHLDVMGHVNHAVYLQIMEDARWNLYDQFGYTKKHIEKEKRGPIVLEMHVKYRKEIITNEIITVKSHGLEYSSILGKISQMILKENGKIAAHAEIIFSYFDLQNRKLIFPSGDWAQMHNQLLRRSTS